MRVIFSSIFFGVGLLSVGCVGKNSTSNYQVVKETTDRISALQYSFIQQSNTALESVQKEDLLGNISALHTELKGYEQWEFENLDWDKNRVLYLPHLTTLTPEQAEAIAQHASYIYLNGITELTPEVARILIQNNPSSLQLNGLRDLSPSVATELKGYFSLEGSLGLNGLEHLSEDSAKELSAIKSGKIMLLGVENLSPETRSMFQVSKNSRGPQRIRFYVKS